MSESDVTRDGVRGERPGRDALVGKGPRRDGRRAGTPGEKFASYYGKPILNRPTWKPLDIAGYFFLGGLAGAGSVVAAGARLTGRPVTARRMTISSLAAITGSLVALVHDLGRPERFPYMLRVFKPTSPMSVGSWLLAAYGPAVTAAAAAEVTGRFGRAGRTATLTAAALGPAVAAYTAVLAADTAVPAWHDGYRELPFVFTGSAAAAASGLALAAAPVAENAPARAAAVFGAALETAAATLMERRLGLVAETYRQGTAGRLTRTAKALTVAGATVAGALGGRSRLAAALGGAALLAGSACTRFGVFHAGIRSAQDPRYVVVPQRERLEARRGADPALRS
jgi:formate-dependent nitrite reductase membrane component NrfD